MSHSNRTLSQLDGFGLAFYLKQTSLNTPQVSFVSDEGDEETKPPAVADPIRSAAFLRNNCRARMVNQIDNFAYYLLPHKQSHSKSIRRAQWKQASLTVRSCQHSLQ